MTAHLVGQILLAAMFGVSASMLIGDIGRNWRTIWGAATGDVSAVRRPKPMIRESTKSRTPRSTPTGERP